MNLTSYNRLLRYLASEGDTSNLSDTSANKRDLLGWIPAISGQIEKYLNRPLHIESRTEYFDAGPDRTMYPLRAVPATTLTSVYVDYDGEWSGAESEISDCIIGVDGMSVHLPYPAMFRAPKALRVIYTGGLGYTGATALWTATQTGTWTVGKYVVGGTSAAVGLVSAVAATTLSIETLYGQFEAGEAVSECDSETAQGASDGSATLGSISQTSVYDAAPEIVRACEMQIRYMWRHKMDYESTGVNKDGQTQRRTGLSPYGTLEPEVQALIDPYRRIPV